MNQLSFILLFALLHTIQAHNAFLLPEQPETRENHPSSVRAAFLGIEPAETNSPTQENSNAVTEVEKRLAVLLKEVAAKKRRATEAQFDSRQSGQNQRAVFPINTFGEAKNERRFLDAVFGDPYANNGGGGSDSFGSDGWDSNENDEYYDDYYDDEYHDGEYYYDENEAKMKRRNNDWKHALGRLRRFMVYNKKSNDKRNAAGKTRRIWINDAKTQKRLITNSKKNIKRTTTDEAKKRMITGAGTKRMFTKSGGRRMVPQFDDKRMIPQSDDKRFITKSGDKRMITQSDDKRMLTQSNDKRIITQSDDKRLITKDGKRSVSFERRFLVDSGAPSSARNNN